MKTLGIGEAARLCGVSPDTLRHYERRALIAPPERTASGYRRYSPDTITRVHQIRRALALGFRLRELAEVFGIRRRGGLPCRKTLGILEQRLGDVEARLAELERLRNVMRTTVAEWRERVDAVGPHTAARLLEER
ncbi:MAG TPA: MerR family transcriptional regulator [Thermoanaerobaculia bacterium]|nr:MerR family transcriptional regulator [Thermoanaerobaculia bacterium]